MVCKVNVFCHRKMPISRTSEATPVKRNPAAILSVLVLLGILVFFASSSPTEKESPGAAENLAKSGDFFLRPFISDRGETVMSLGGGKHPVDNLTLPSIAFGEEGGVRRLQVAMPLDWTHPDSRKAYRMIRELYGDEDVKGLPAIDLYLLPVYALESGKSVHEAVLTVHLGSNRVESLPGLLARLASGTLAADAREILAHVADADPDLVPRWESLSINQRDRFSDAFQRASVQQRHNSSRLDDASAHQLIVFDSVLTGMPSRRMLADFLRAAASRQHDYLTSPEGAVRLVIDRGCKCKDPGHDHSPQTEAFPVPLADGLSESGASRLSIPATGGGSSRN